MWGGSSSNVDKLLMTDACHHFIGRAINALRHQNENRPVILFLLTNWHSQNSMLEAPPLKYILAFRNRSHILQQITYLTARIISSFIRERLLTV